MFLPSKIHHNYCHSSSQKFIPNTFGMLCWNVYKSNDSSAFKEYLKKVESQCDLLLFQEATFSDKKPFVLSDYIFDAAANLEFREKFYGVLTASRVLPTEVNAYLSKGKEGFIGTYKSLLISLYSFEEGSTLLVFNLHAINFRENQQFNRELEHFLELLKKYEGAMIVAGDFNTWSKTRTEQLYNFKDELGLDTVPFKQDGVVKSFMGNNLDFILYRGLELVEYNVDITQKISDHNPLFAQFKK